MIDTLASCCCSRTTSSHLPHHKRSVCSCCMSRFQLVRRRRLVGNRARTLQRTLRSIGFKLLLISLNMRSSTLYSFKPWGIPHEHTITTSLMDIVQRTWRSSGPLSRTLSRLLMLSDFQNKAHDSNRLRIVIHDFSSGYESQVKHFDPCHFELDQFPQCHLYLTAAGYKNEG